MKINLKMPSYDNNLIENGMKSHNLTLKSGIFAEDDTMTVSKIYLLNEKCSPLFIKINFINKKLTCNLKLCTESV